MSKLNYQLPTFSKGDKVYALISSTSYPNLLLLVKAKIIDYQHKGSNPLYRIKILKIYSSFSHVKRFFTNSKFSKNLKTRTYYWTPDPKEFDSLTDFENELNADNKGSYYIWVESLMLFEKKNEALSTLNEIMDTAIEMRLHELEMMTTYSTYDGMFSVKTSVKFWNWIYSKFPKFKEFNNKPKSEY